VANQPRGGDVAAFSRLFKVRFPRYGSYAMQGRPITIRDLYPEMNDEELAEAEANLRRYVAVIVRIHDRLKAEGKTWPDPPADLTLSAGDFTIPNERSNSPKKRN
jgi:hypothetical protein